MEAVKKKKVNKKGYLKHILTITVITVSWGKFDSHNLLKVMSHAQSPERWGEVNFVGLSFWTIRVISYLISSSNVLHHPCSKIHSISKVTKQKPAPSFPLCVISFLECLHRSWKIIKKQLSSLENGIANYVFDIRFLGVLPSCGQSYLRAVSLWSPSSHGNQHTPCKIHKLWTQGYESCRCPRSWTGDQFHTLCLFHRPQASAKKKEKNVEFLYLDNTRTYQHIYLHVSSGNVTVCKKST